MRQAENSSRGFGCVKANGSYVCDVNTAVPHGSHVMNVFDGSDLPGVSFHHAAVFWGGQVYSNPKSFFNNRWKS
jgi:hypothetical protein